MKLTSSSIILGLLAGTSVAIPHNQPRQDVNPDDPSASDPQTPPTDIKDPPRPQSISDNPFVSGFDTVPDSCTNLWDPTEQCLKDLETQNNNDVGTYSGDLKFEKGHGCTDEEKLKLEIAAWDALTLANFGGKDPVSAKEIATWRAYIGPDFSAQQSRIVDNLKRIQDHRAKKKFDIIVTCNDVRDRCEEVDKNGRLLRVGGYAWTQKGYFGYRYQHINLCPIYFNLESLEEKFEFIEEQLKNGNKDYAASADWHKNRGQYFLHEMMHLDIVGQPHITDEWVMQDNTGPKAYGPTMVYKLAQRGLSQGGGATRASTNADSYAWLANSLYFYDATGYFPAPPNYRDRAVSAEADARGLDIFPVHLGEFQGKVDDATFNSRFDAEIAGIKAELPGAPPPGPTCQSNSDCSSPNCAGGGAVYSCVEGTCQCGSPAPPGPPPAGLRCKTDVSEEECTSKYVCPEGFKGPGCVKTSLLEEFWCTCY